MYRGKRLGESLCDISTMSGSTVTSDRSEEGRSNRSYRYMCGSRLDDDGGGWRGTPGESEKSRAEGGDGQGRGGEE
jgi:hypothetical protein